VLVPWLDVLDDVLVAWVPGAPLPLMVWLLVVPLLDGVPSPEPPKWLAPSPGPP